MNYLLTLYYRDGEGPAATGLKPETATTLRGETITDGPYAETKEILFSLMIIDVEDLDGRLTRARNKVSKGRIPFKVPSDDLLPERLAGVLRAVYLVFNEGHAATRAELRAEGVRLARLLVRLMPDVAEAHGLLALLLLTDARSPARVHGEELVALEEQDRARWDHARIDEGVAVLERALRLPGAGAYSIQAAIAALHDQAPSFADTDWAQIAGLYGALARVDASPVVTINRAVAVGFAEGPAAGSALLDAVEGLERYQSFHAARAELLRRWGTCAAPTPPTGWRSRSRLMSPSGPPWSANARPWGSVEHMIGALILGFIAGVIGRVLMPGDVFRHMSGLTSWLVSLVLGLIGAAVGWLLFT